MKRKNILKVLLFVVAIIIMPKKVFAANCDLAVNAQSGDLNLPGGTTCTLSEDITINEPITISEGNVRIDFNGHKITSNSDKAFHVTGSGSLYLSDTTSNTGAASSSQFVIFFDSTGDLTLEGGTYSGMQGLHVKKANKVLVHNGTFKGTNMSANIENAENVIIERGTFKNEVGADPQASQTGLSVTNSNEVIVYDGTFEGGYTGGNFVNISDLKINGGTFVGTRNGIHLANIANQKNNFGPALESDGILFGGAFKCTGNEVTSGAITYSSVWTDKDIFNTIIGNNYHYSEKFKVNSDYGAANSTEFFSEIKNVSVVEGAPTEEQKIEPAKINEDKQQTKEEAKVANPKTGSALYLYVIAFMLVSGIAVFGTYKYHKKLNK